MTSSTSFLIAMIVSALLLATMVACNINGLAMYMGLGLIGLLFIWVFVVYIREGLGPINVSQLDELCRRAFKKNDPDALFELVQLYEEGENKSFLEKHPKQARCVFNAALRLVELVETNQLEGKPPQLEDYYYLGLMYEEGFTCHPNVKQAIAYYQQALATTACWDANPNHYRQKRAQVEKRLAALLQRKEDTR